MKENLETINDLLRGMGEEEMTESEARDFGIRDEEMGYNELYYIAHDIHSESQTIKAENKQAWRYEL